MRGVLSAYRCAAVDADGDDATSFRTATVTARVGDGSGGTAALLQRRRAAELNVVREWAAQTGSDAGARWSALRRA